MELNSVLTSMLFMLSITLQTTNATTYKETLLKGKLIGLSDTLVSANGNFELGFFTEQNSKHYVGMWFKKVPKDKIVWVANRNHAATGSSAALTIYKDGNLVVLDGDTVYFVTNVSNINSTHAMFLDSGNLLLVNDSNLNILWESFDHPTDTLLPGMKIGFDPESGQICSLRSWTSALDPSPGVFSLELNVSMQNLIIKRESAIYWIGDENFESLINRDYMITNQDYWTWQGEYGSRLVLEESGALNQQNWSQDTQQWVSFQSSKCRTNAICGNFGVCNPQAHNPCGCLKGFKPYDANSWKKGKTSAGCVRKIELLCTNTSSNGLNDDFFPLEGVKLPSDSSLDFDTDKASKCVNACSTNCSCIAYAYDLTEGRCLLWHVQLFNLKNVSVDVGVNNNSPTLFLKLAASELKNNESNTRNNPDHKSSHSRKIALIIVILILFVALLTLALFAYYYRRKKLRGNGEDLLLFDVGMSMKVNSSEITDSEKVTKVDKREVRLPLFNFVSVSAATDNFSAENKLGEGGFGPVYKGKLLNGDEVAVKRLSSRSGQGWEELKNEALLIAKLQHNNLVRLLGCCIERDEKMLIYEFMPNKSLDFFLFDATKGRTLDWGTRVRIIDGISQGLLYLHQYSRFRIIHRDLKASNILLDINMNPKISDFGMARMFGGNQLQANTNRIVGTYGYMAPEYALEGLFSVKSDVFSFGVLLLEIISGKKNTGFYNTNSLNLLGHAWDLWTSGRGIELMDSVVQDASIKKMVVQRYVNIALLCVQESAADRPTMSDVVSMLGNENAVLPYPKTYAFLNVRGMNKHSGSDGSSTGNVSVNAMTASVMEAR